MIDCKYKYYAFISYKREDEEWAKWLQHKLEHYKLPSNLNGRTDLPKEIRPVFKDTSELTPGNLPKQINEALEQSKYLIVICSPRSAQSEWVNKEVETFKSMGKSDNIIPYIIDGIPFSSNHEEECFPQGILSLPQEQEILGVNINEMGRDAAAVKVVARMFDICFDELWQRYEREKKRKRNIITAATIAFVIALIGLASWMYLQRQETLRANWEMMENQARMVAERAKDEVKNGNTYDAILALLEMLPEDGSRPFVPELEEALRIAYDSLLHSKWNYRYMGRCMDDIYFSNDEKYIVSEDFFTIDIYDTKSLCQVMKIPVNELGARKYTFLSENKDTLYEMAADSLDCYSCSTGKYIKRIPLTNDLLCQWIGTDNNGIHLSYLDNHFSQINEWKKSIGLPQEIKVLNYFPANNVVLYAKETTPDKVTIYDCMQKRNIWTIDDAKGCSSIASNGNHIVFESGLIANIKDSSIFKFNGGVEDAEQSVVTGPNNQLLLYSPNNDHIKLFDILSLELIDSVKVTSCDDCKINSAGNLLIVKNGGGWCVYIKHDSFRRNIKNENAFTLSMVKEYGYKNITWLNYPDTIIVDKKYSICVDYDGMHFTKISGSHTNWDSIEKNYICLINATFQNNHYAIVSLESRYDGSNMTAIIDFESGAIVKQIKDYGGDETYYYNEKDEKLIIMENEVVVETIEFPSFAHLVSLCREAAKRVGLGETARRRFFCSTD